MAYVRRQRRINEEEGNHDRWVISYADFITLLFAFFVVMYSISSVNEGKYRVLSDALETSFSNPGESLPIFNRSGNPDIQPIHLDVNPKRTASESDRESAMREQEAEEILELNEISGEIEKQFYKQIDNDDISVKSNDDWIEVEIKSSLLFRSGIAKLSPGAIPIIADLAGIIKEYNNPVQVEGFTDNIPINNEQFSSNWELSTSRAVAVLELLIKNGMKPESLAAIGYGEFQSIADNSTAEGRQKNRRVVLIISRGQKLRRNMEDTQQEQVLNGVEKNIPTISEQAENTIKSETEEEIISIMQNPEQTPAPRTTNEKSWAIQLEGGGLLFTNELQTSPEETTRP